MANDFYTLIVVPHAKAKFRKFSVSVRLLKWCAGAIGISVIVMVVVIWKFSELSTASIKAKRLEAENTELRRKNLQYETEAPRLHARIKQLTQIGTKLAVMAGVEKALPDDQVGGVGGVSSSDLASPVAEAKLDAGSLLRMDSTLSKLSERFQELESYYRDRQVLLASTPSVWPVHGYLSAGFGNRLDPFTGEKDFHPGLDISTPHGTKVTAPADGIVISSAEKGGYGNAIVIDHGYEVVTRYGHLSGYNVKAGQRVKRGDVIGFVGSTGRSTAPHLHYEVWIRDQAQNPIHYILDEYRSFG
jgi:murein DD-endopeptidase MepM/ murein hydrolase activator NlpD